MKVTTSKCLQTTKYAKVIEMPMYININAGDGLVNTGDRTWFIEFTGYNKNNSFTTRKINVTITLDDDNVNSKIQISNIHGDEKGIDVIIVKNNDNNTYDFYIKSSLEDSFIVIDVVNSNAYGLINLIGGARFIHDKPVNNICVFTNYSGNKKLGIESFVSFNDENYVFAHDKSFIKLDDGIVYFYFSLNVNSPTTVDYEKIASISKEFIPKFASIEFPLITGATISSYIQIKNDGSVLVRNKALAIGSYYCYGQYRVI